MKPPTSSLRPFFNFAPLRENSDWCSYMFFKANGDDWLSRKRARLS